MSSFYQFYCYGFRDPLEDGIRCQQCTCERCRSCLREGICFICALDPEDSLIMRNENLSTIPEKESDEFIKSSVEDLDPIPSESEDTSGSDKKSSGSTTTRSDYSLSDYEAFYFDDDHINEKSSGSTTTYSHFSLPEYDSFIFNLSIDPFPPTDRSVSHHEESSMNSLTSYLHQSMIVFTSMLRPTQES
nr:hypothetical protein [Tanacetum cinerariifolium]